MAADREPGTVGVAEAVDQMEQALRRLPARRRTIFLLHRLDGLSYAEIAALYGTSVKRVERHIAAAMLHLDCELDGVRRSWWRRWLDRWW